jgi:hypothetical protein
MAHEETASKAFTNIFSGVTFGASPLAAAQDDVTLARQQVRRRILQVNKAQLQRIQSYLGADEKIVSSATSRRCTSWSASCHPTSSLAAADAAARAAPVGAGAAAQAGGRVARAVAARPAPRARAAPVRRSSWGEPARRSAPRACRATRATPR